MEMEIVEFDVELSHGLIKHIHKLPQAIQVKILKNIKLWAERLKKFKGKKRAKYFYTQIDQAVSDDLASFKIKENLPISCKKGCSHCCHMNIDVFKDEATLLAGKIKSGEISYNKAEFDAQKNMSAADFQNNPKPCIFLKDSQCSIYKYRPATCRKYFVVGDPNDCIIGDKPIIVANPALYNAEIIYTGMSRASPFHANSSLPYMLDQALQKRI